MVQDFQSKIQKIYDDSVDVYHHMLECGVAKECARDILPLSTPTTLYMHGTLRSWLTYADLRTGNGTQYEHKVIADQVKQLIALQFPQSFTAMWSYDEPSSS